MVELMTRRTYCAENFPQKKPSDGEEKPNFLRSLDPVCVTICPKSILRSWTRFLAKIPELAGQACNAGSRNTGSSERKPGIALRNEAREMFGSDIELSDRSAHFLKLLHVIY
jgi:hypothetical protein